MYITISARSLADMETDRLMQHLHTGWSKWTGDRWAPLYVMSWPVWGWKPSNSIRKSSSYLLSTGQMPDQHSWERWEEVELVWSPVKQTIRGESRTIYPQSFTSAQVQTHCSSSNTRILTTSDLLSTSDVGDGQRVVLEFRNVRWRPLRVVDEQSFSHNEYW